MKRLLCSLLLVAGLAQGVPADDTSPLLLDDTYAGTKSWLARQNLTLTGGSAARDFTTPFRQDAILFYGEAVGNSGARTPLQRELGAKRAAEVVAQRAVAEYLNGFTLVGDTLVKDGILEHDSLRSTVNGLVRGVQVVFSEYNREKNSAIAIVKLGMHGPGGFASSLYERMLGDREVGRKLAELDGRPAPPYRHEAESLPESFDGLIIDAAGQPFRPALINRVFSTKGELLYDPSKVSRKILVEQGCGEYTTSVDMARKALASRGVTNPLVVTASGALGGADLQVSDGDAVTIFSANRKSDFFTAARVAFVLK